MITQKELKEILYYNLETGVFTWNTAVGKRIKIGAVAGNLGASGYHHIRYKSRQYKAHRLAWLYVHGKFPDGQIDHKDGNPSNNCFSNLRECSPSENQKNHGIRSNNTSGYRGVCWHKGARKWKAAAQLDGKTIHLGLFLTEEEAAKAYDNFAQKHHGKFYRDTLNYDNKN